MAVVLSNCALTVRARAHPLVERDARGTPIPTVGDNIAERGPFPGAANLQGDGTWKLRLDPRCWPVTERDTVTDGARTWVVRDEPRLIEVPGCSAADYVSVVGTLDPPARR